MSERKITLNQGTFIELESQKYKLLRDLELKYVDHQGAFAGIYFINPITNEKYIGAPNLEDGDIESEAIRFLQSLASRKSSLERMKSQEELKFSGDIKDLEALTGLLVAA